MIEDGNKELNTVDSISKVLGGNCTELLGDKCIEQDVDIIILSFTCSGSINTEGGVVTIQVDENSTDILLSITTGGVTTDNLSSYTSNGNDFEFTTYKEEV